MSNPCILMSDLYKGYKILEYPDGSLSQILDRGLALMNAAIHRFRRAFFVRMDLKFPEDRHFLPNNDLIRLFMEEFRLERMTAGYDFFYLWVWEQNDSINHHYHCCFVFNKNRTQSIYGHVRAARKIWARVLGLVPPNAKKEVVKKAMKKAPVWDCTKNKYGEPQKNGLEIDVNAPDYEQQYDTCFHWLSYLAKVSTKENIPEGQRKFGSSILPSTAGLFPRPRPRPRLVVRPMLVSGQVVNMPEIL